MKSNTSPIISIGATYLLFIAVGIFYFIFNYLTPIVLDDCGYTRSGQTICSIISEQAHDYMTFNGRFLSHGLVQFIGGIMGKNVVNILNAGMVMALIYLLAYVGMNYKNVSFSYLYPLAVLLVWFGYPDQYTTFFMVAGSFNYLWASVFALCFLVIYCQAYTHEENPSTFKIIAMTFAAFLIGLWGEMYAISLAPALFVDLLVNKQRRNKQTILIFIFFCIGAGIEILAPGNFLRLHNVAGSGGHTAIGTQMVNLLQAFLGSALLWVYIGIFILYIALKIKHVQFAFREDFLFYIVAIILYLLFVLVTGTLWQRMLFGVYTFSFLILLRLCSYIPKHQFTMYILYVITIVIITIDAGKEIQTMFAQKYAIENVIEESKSAKDAYIPWLGIEGSRKSINDNTLTVDPDNWQNTMFVKYYDIPSVSVVPQALYTLILNNDMLIPNKLTIIDEEFSVVLLNDTTPETISSINIPYMTTGYVFHNKIKRIIECVGFETLAYRIYGDYRDILFGELLLESFENYHDNIRVHRSSTDAHCYVRDKQGRTMVFIRNKQLSHYNAPIGDIEVHYE